MSFSDVRRLVLTTLSVSIALSATCAADGGSSPFAFVGVNVLTMADEGALIDQTVVVRDGVISEVGSSHDVTISPDTRVVDGDDTTWLMPGLADVHVHLRRSGAQWLALFLVNGVTTVLNMSGTPAVNPWRTSRR